MPIGDIQDSAGGVGSVLILAMVVLTSASSSVLNDGEVKATVITPNVCRHGLSPQPKGPYSLFSFCDDASGTSIGLVYSSAGDPRSETWSLSDRFWQDSTWCLDVTSYVWIPGGNRVAVATSGIYGTGGLYLLILDERKAVVLEAGKPGQSVMLRSYFPSSKSLRFVVESEEGSTQRTVVVP